MKNILGYLKISSKNIPEKQLKKWMTALPDVRFVNLYCSSETAGICCFCETTEAPEDDVKFIIQSVSEIYVRDIPLLTDIITMRKNA